VVSKRYLLQTALMHSTIKKRRKVPLPLARGVGHEHSLRVIEIQPARGEGSALERESYRTEKETLHRTHSDKSPLNIPVQEVTSRACQAEQRMIN